MSRRDRFRRGPAHLLAVLGAFLLLFVASPPARAVGPGPDPSTLTPIPGVSVSAVTTPPAPGRGGFSEVTVTNDSDAPVTITRIDMYQESAVNSFCYNTVVAPHTSVTCGDGFSPRYPEVSLWANLTDSTGASYRVWVPQTINATPQDAAYWISQGVWPSPVVTHDSQSVIVQPATTVAQLFTLPPQCKKLGAKTLPEALAFPTTDKGVCGAAEVVIQKATLDMINAGYLNPGPAGDAAAQQILDTANAELTTKHAKA